MSRESHKAIERVKKIGSMIQQEQREHLESERRAEPASDSAGSGAAHGSANLVEELKDSAAKLYERAKRARQNLVRLAPQYRNKDKYNAEGEYLQDIRLAMGMRRIALTLAQRLESESSPNS